MFTFICNGLTNFFEYSKNRLPYESLSDDIKSSVFFMRRTTTRRMQVVAVLGGRVNKAPICSAYQRMFMKCHNEPTNIPESEGSHEVVTCSVCMSVCMYLSQYTNVDIRLTSELERWTKLAGLFPFFYLPRPPLKPLYSCLPLPLARASATAPSLVSSVLQWKCRLNKTTFWLRRKMFAWTYQTTTVWPACVKER